MSTLSPESISQAISGEFKEYFATAKKIIAEAETYAEADINLAILHTAQRTYHATLNQQPSLIKYGLMGGAVAGGAVGVVTFASAPAGTTFFGNVLSNAAKSSVVGGMGGVLLEHKKEHNEKKLGSLREQVAELILKAELKLRSFDVVVSSEGTSSPALRSR